jgi:hypothetical protein
MTHSWYHVSAEPLGETPNLLPRIPERLAPGEDAVVHRICVAPAISNCLRLVAWDDYEENFWVYGLSTRPEKAGLNLESPKRLVPDYGKTPRHIEAWLTRPATFTLLGRVRMVRINLITGRPCYHWIELRGQACTDARLQHHPDVMPKAMVEAHAEHEATIAAIQAEMEAEVRVRGGKMIGDVLLEVAK